MKPRLNKPVKAIWHHANGMLLFPCAATQHHTVDVIDNSHKSRWPGFTSRVYKNAWGNFYHVGYHLVIDLNNEKITRTRAFTEEGAACIGMNTKAVQIIIIGNYDKCSGETIPKEKEYLIGEAWDMIKEECPHLTITDNVPHRKYAKKSCFGDSLADNYIQKVLIGTKTVQSEEEKQNEILHITTLQEELIEVLRTLIALLSQRLTGRRLSIREVPKKKARPLA